MKKYCFIIFCFAFLLSCNNVKKNQPKKNTKHKLSVKKIKISKIKVDIDFIKKSSTEGITSFNMDSITDPQKYIDNNYFNKTLGKFPLNDEGDIFLKAEEFERFSYYQWEQNEQFFLFNLLHQDESCCLYMYLFVCDTKGTLLHIELLGLGGGDGGWYENDIGNRIGFGKYKLMYNSFTENDKYEQGNYIGYTKEHEYTELIFNLTENTFNRDTLVYRKKDTLIKK